jgi:hypothetical protein
VDPARPSIKPGEENSETRIKASRATAAAVAPPDRISAQAAALASMDLFFSAIYAGSLFNSNYII